MIRYAALSVVVMFLSLYAFRDWYKSLCGLIILVGIFQHPDIRGPMMNIQGLNLWNILLLFVLMGWLFSRGMEGRIWDMPHRINVLLLLYLTVIFISFIRLLTNSDMIIQSAIITGIKVPSRLSLWSEYFINTIKWVIPGLLLFDGCRNRSRFNMAICAILAIYFLLGLQVIKWMPLSAITSGNDLSYRASKILLNEVGYSRVNLSMLLAGASWATFSVIILFRKQFQRSLLLLAGLAMIFAQMLTGGRAGYISWVAVGLIISSIRWKKNFILMPAVVIVLLLAIPGVSERISRGFTPDNLDSNPLVEETKSFNKETYHWYTITSGRNVAWPPVIEKISAAPVLGYGGLAMQSLGISAMLEEVFAEDFTHPHNGYLEFILDNGLLGFLPILIFYLLIIKYSLSLLRDLRSPVFTAGGGICFSLVAALLIASFSSQTFYPREGAVGMWCAIGLMLRVYVERSRMANPSNKSLAQNGGELIGSNTLAGSI